MVFAVVVWFHPDDRDLSNAFLPCGIQQYDYAIIDDLSEVEREVEQLLRLNRARYLCKVEIYDLEINKDGFCEAIDSEDGMCVGG